MLLPLFDGYVNIRLNKWLNWPLFSAMILVMIDWLDVVKQDIDCNPV
jgi:hypothetical protein